MDRAKIKKPVDVLPLVKRYKNCRQENFLAITLDGNHSAIKVHHVTKGVTNKTIIHPRECFYHAIKDNAVAVIFAHNHPSGSVDPSQEDEKITKQLCMAGRILGFHVLDHIIFSKYGNYESFRERGTIDDDEYSQWELEQYVAELPFNGKEEE